MILYAQDPSARSLSFQTGKIRRLLEKGFGFIEQPDSDGEFFFHSNELIGVPFDSLREGDLVDFEIVAHPQRPFAVNVGRNLQANEHAEISNDADGEGNADGEVETDAEDEVDDDDIDDDGESEVQVVLLNMSRKLAEIIARKPKELREIEWRQLEHIIAEVFAGLGFETELTPGSKDGGKDVIITYRTSKGTKSYFVEIKHWKCRTKVGPTPVKNFVHLIAKENKNGGLLLATYGFAKTAFDKIFEISRDRVWFGVEEKVVTLCRSYVRAKEGIWKPPDSMECVISENTIV